MPNVSYVVSGANVSSVTTAARGDRTILRRGILLPFQRDRKNDFANGVGEDLIVSNALLVLSTRASDGRIPGEIPWRQNFGTLLHKIRHQNAKPVIFYQARAYVVDGLARWEPRVRVVAFDLKAEQRRFICRTTVRIIESERFGRANEEQTFTIETTVSE